MLGAAVSRGASPIMVVARSCRYAMVRQRRILLGRVSLRALRYVADNQGVGTFMILILLLLLLVFGGLSGWGGYRYGGSPQHGVGFGLGTVLVILLICYLLGMFH